MPPWNDESSVTGKNHTRVLLVDPVDARSALIQRALLSKGIHVDIEREVEKASTALRSQKMDERYPAVLIDLVDLPQSTGSWEMLLQMLSEAAPSAIHLGFIGEVGLQLLSQTVAERQGVLVLPCVEEEGAEVWSMMISALIKGEIARASAPARRIEAYQKQTLALLRTMVPVLDDAIAASNTPAPVPLPASGIGRLLARLAEADPKALTGGLVSIGGGLAALAAAITALLQQGSG